MSRLPRLCAACLIAFGLWIGLASSANAGMNDVPTPTITGPQPVTPTSYPFMSTTRDLASYGYTEEEYWVSGNAFRYNTGGLTTGSKIVTGGPNNDGAFPYKTRIVVRRPIDPDDYNGTTVLEWYNVTANFDVEWNWLNDPDYMMSHGYTWIGVSAQNAGVNSLRSWNASRYGAAGGNLNVNPTGATPTDSLSYDIFASVAKMLRGSYNGDNPMGALQTDTIVASGESQSGGRLVTYYNNIQPIHEMIDSFLITVANGVLRSDRPQTKAIRVVTDNEVSTQQNDPDTSAYRRWEVAGGSHLPFMAYVNGATELARDGGASVANCSRRPLSRVPWPLVYNRALDAIVKWNAGTEVAPNAPRVNYNGSALAKDVHGNTIGGIRLPEVEVPTARNDGTNSIGSPLTTFSLFCSLFGSWTQFDSAKLHTLYSDYGDYKDQFDSKAQDAVSAGFINSDDLAKLKNTATNYTRIRPTRPSLDAGTSPGNTGDIDLGWRGPPPTPIPYSAATGTTYEVQAQDSSGAPWATVPGAGALSARSLSLTNYPEGTQKFRVRNTSTIAALHPDPQVNETTPFSETRTVVVDKTAPADPTLSADRAPEYAGDGGWWKGTVTVSSESSDPDLADGSPGSGVDPATVAAPEVRNTTGSYSFTDKVSDLAGNESGEGAKSVKVDATDPTLMLVCPSEAIVGQPGVTANYGAADVGSGLASPALGAPSINTSTVGTRTTQVTATDNVGNTKTKSCTTDVVYDYGLVKPSPGDGSRKVRKGKPAAVRIAVRDYNGNPVGNADPRLDIAPIVNNVVGTYRTPDSQKPKNQNGAFRYAKAKGLYVFVIDTSTMGKKPWSLRVTLDDGRTYTARITVN